MTTTATLTTTATATAARGAADRRDALPARLTADDLRFLPNGEHVELVDGRIIEKTMGATANWIALRVMSRVLAHVEAHNLGWTFPNDTQFRCFPDDDDKVRKPDGAFVRRDRFPTGRPPAGMIVVPPDLAVEVVSPHDTAGELELKIEDYLRAGVRLIWVLYPDSRTAYVYTLDGSVRRLRAAAAITASASPADSAAPAATPSAPVLGDQLNGLDVLPGFVCSLSQIFSV